jgi:hypothetical protein
LKELLATKTVVFVGYSLRDSDFVRLYELIQSRMGELLPRSYMVTIDESDPEGVAEGMHVIRTSGVHFLRKLKEQFRKGELLPEERFTPIPLIRAIVRELHHEMIAKGEMSTDPAMLMCACYQDGLMDAFDHIEANKAHGDYYHRCYTERLVEDTYAELLDERVRRGVWLSAAYVEGYLAGLSYLIADDDARKQMPLYYVSGATENLRTYDDYEAVAPLFETLNKQAYEFARHEAERLAPGTDFHHLPVLI